MTPISTSDRVISRIEVLDERLKKEKARIKPIRLLRKRKIQDLNERLQLNWDRLYDFYPDMISVTDIKTFRDLLSSGMIPNKIKEETLDSRIYTVGSKEWKDFLDVRSIN